MVKGRPAQPLLGVSHSSGGPQAVQQPGGEHVDYSSAPHHYLEVAELGLEDPVLLLPRFLWNSPGHHADHSERIGSAPHEVGLPNQTGQLLLCHPDLDTAQLVGQRLTGKAFCRDN